MKQIHRKQVHLSKPFVAQKGIQIGYQEERKMFSYWFESAENDTLWAYKLVATGESFDDEYSLLQTIVLPDGFHVFHLVGYDYKLAKGTE